MNPLHIDPAVAQVAGFKNPVLHGLCTYGFAVRHVMAKYADNDAARIKCIHVRSRVYPSFGRLPNATCVISEFRRFPPL